MSKTHNDEVSKIEKQILDHIEKVKREAIQQTERRYEAREVKRIRERYFRNGVLDSYVIRNHLEDSQDLRNFIALRPAYFQLEFPLCAADYSDKLTLTYQNQGNFEYAVNTCFNDDGPSMGWLFGTLRYELCLTATVRCLQDMFEYYRKFEDKED